MITVLEEHKGDLLAVHIDGKIEEKDYEMLNPLLEQTVNFHDNPKAYLEVGELDGVTLKAIIEDFKNIPDYNEFDKVAVVGDKTWKETLTQLFNPILHPKIKYFNFEEKEKAMEWLKN